MMKFKRNILSVSVHDFVKWGKNAIKSGRIIAATAILLVALLTPTLTYAQEGRKTHTVKKGQTLFSIAQKYDVSVDQIKEWNDLTSNILQAGQVLYIQPSGKNESDESPGNTNQKSTTGSYYIVKSGDTLYEIAKKHNMSVAKLKSLNDLTSNNIRVGQRLLVRQPTPTPSVAKKATGSAPQGQFLRYTIENGENWSDIIRKFSMDSVELARLNPETDPSDFIDGRKITVLKSPSVTYENPYRIDAQLKLISSSGVVQYDEDKRGTPTSSGELYNPKALTAAHSSISLGSIVYIVNQQNRRGIFVKINDRTDQNSIKLSERAYKVLNFTGPNPRVQIYKRP